MDIIIDNKPVPGAPRRAASAFTARDIPKRNHDSINSSIASTRHWSEIDEEEHDDPVMVAEYSEDIIDYSLKLEAETMPNPNYMDNQPELDFRMRGILIDWLIEVHHRFHMLGETLFMAVNLIDRFLTMNVVSLQKFQLVGITALFIAAKYEEIVVPPLASFLYLTDGGYSANEVKQAERYMLNALKFDVGYANPLNFLRRISKADDYDAASRTLAKYLMEMQCVHHKLIQYPPSLLAAAALCLARKMINKGPWDENLVHYSGYYIEQLEPCIAIMIEYMQDGIAHKAFHAKYASRKMLRVSVYATDWATKLVRDRVLVATPSAAASNVNSTTAAAFGDN
ncbi:hypothetical protein GQ42DRAFT_126123 [Ramicandelaber brevisporus]|nr:hypothetical protein GQ42DRAFT_126123 [Ramicandelaber brevisporus]